MTLTGYGVIAVADVDKEVANGKLWRMNAYFPVKSLASLELTEEMTRIG